ncbi:MAG: prepilin-type N-terminal cleavage/methylation domain-containing protein [Pirellulales bacterium]|nr:prepilin-type N-terminal cleavage/methylation domain-containing protein [Pirellulales bacterium]
MSGQPARRGFTLFEVILSLAIVGGAMAVISQVVWSGLENARMTQELVQAELLAENVMAELLVGIRPLESVQDSPFDEDDSLEDPEQWVFSVDISPLEIEGLQEARVTVRANNDKPRAVQFSLVRWILVPETEE